MEVAQNKSKSIVLIDNSEVDNFINHKIIEDAGISNVLVFTSSNKALTYLLETNICYDLILVEIHLPVLNGFDFVDLFIQKELKKKHKNICFISASICPLDKEKALEKNITFVPKPLTENSLLTLMQNL